MGDEYPLDAAARQDIVDHIDRYVASDGADGHLVNGVGHLILTTTGRTSGEPRRAALVYGEDDGRYLIVGSLAGYDRPPHWYLNLVADPEVTVQVEADRFRAHARTATGDERARLWAHMCEVFPRYVSHQSKTTREIPVVILERA